MSRTPKRGADLLKILSTAETPLSTEQIAPLYGASIEAARTTLRKLLREGSITRSSAGPGCVWTTSDRAAELPEAKRLAKQRNAEAEERAFERWCEERPVQRVVPHQAWAGSARVVGPRSVFEVHDLGLS